MGRIKLYRARTLASGYHPSVTHLDLSLNGVGRRIRSAISSSSTSSFDKTQQAHDQSATSSRWRNQTSTPRRTFHWEAPRRARRVATLKLIDASTMSACSRSWLMMMVIPKTPRNSTTPRTQRMRSSSLLTMN